MKKYYDSEKLSLNLPLFEGKKLLILGMGAVGSHLAEMLLPMDVHLVCVDFDRLSADNSAKCSHLFRFPEDEGQNKALCMARRFNDIRTEDATVSGIDTSVVNLGPEIYAAFDYVFLDVDNYPAKIYVNDQILQLPPERRPIVIMAGTHGELAESTMLNFDDFCLRCLVDESWLQRPKMRDSCSGPRIRSKEDFSLHVRTSGPASTIAAALSFSQFRSSILGQTDLMNRSVTYFGPPDMSTIVSSPVRKRGCINCDAIEPVEDIQILDGCTHTLKLRDALEQIRQQLGSTDFEVFTHCFDYNQIMQNYFIVDDYCPVCGAPVEILKHEGRCTEEDLLCDHCRSYHLEPDNSQNFGHVCKVSAFTLDSHSSIQEMTLYNLGYPMGSYIQVMARNGAQSLEDIDKLRFYNFTCKNDPEAIFHISKL